MNRRNAVRTLLGIALGTILPVHAVPAGAEITVYYSPD